MRTLEELEKIVLLLEDNLELAMKAIDGLGKEIDDLKAPKAKTGTIQDQIGVPIEKLGQMLKEHRTEFNNKDVPDAKKVANMLGVTRQKIAAIMKANGLWED